MIKVIITGVTGMVGEGVMLTCLDHPEVSEVLIVGRRHYEKQHPKLKELIVPDFANIAVYSDQLKGYDGCFFCAGVSSIGMTEVAFTKATYDVVVPFAKVLAQLNPQMVFTYVSGSGTDSTETGKVMWARVKGRTENALAALPFRGEYNFRPGVMKAVKGQKSLKSFYKVIVFLYPVWSALLPNWSCTLEEVGTAMINCVLKGYAKKNIEVEDIKQLAKS
jgi:uncharacterized protein YbjT (DUF2867 family)